MSVRTGGFHGVHREELGVSYRKGLLVVENPIEMDGVLQMVIGQVQVVFVIQNSSKPKLKSLF